MSVITGIQLIVYGIQDQNYDCVIERFDGAAWVAVGYLENVQSNGSLFTESLPLDGITRQYRAKFVEPGFADGPYFATLTATPVILDDIDFQPTPLPSLSVRSTLVSSTPTSVEYDVVVVDQLPDKPITVSFTDSRNVSVTPSSATINSGAVTRITSTKPASTAGDGRVIVRANSPNRIEGVDAIDIPAQDAADGGVGNVTVALGSTTVSSQAVQTPFTLTGTTRYVEVWAREDRVNPTGISSDNYQTGFQLKNSPFVTGQTAQVPVAVAGNWITTWFVPFDGQGRRGTIQFRTNQSAIAPTTPPDAFQARSNIAIAATSVTNRVQMPANNLPATIRVYRGGVFFADIARTAAANGNQDMVHSGLTPNTTYVWQYEPLASDGTAGPRTADLSTTTAAQQLDPPTVVFVGTVNEKIRFQWTNPVDYPSGATLSGEYERGGPWLALVSVTNEVLEALEDNSGQAGTARFRVSAPNFTTSDFSTPIVWFGGGNPL